MAKIKSLLFVVFSFSYFSLFYTLSFDTKRYILPEPDIGIDWHSSSSVIFNGKEVVYTTPGGSILTLRKLTNSEQTDKAAEFTVRTFFQDTSDLGSLDLLRASINPFRGKSIDTLFGLQRTGLASNLSKDEKKPASMFSCEDSDGETIGFAEICVESFNEGTKQFVSEATCNEPHASLQAYALVSLAPRIDNFCVLKSYRNQGVGKALLSSCLSEAKLWGYEQALLLVDAKNVKAREFYKSQGLYDVAYEGEMSNYNVEGFSLRSTKTPKYLMKRRLWQGGEEDFSDVWANSWAWPSIDSR